MAQFYVDDVDLDGRQEIPVDNFYWMTDEGKKLRLVMHAGRVFLEVEDKAEIEDETFDCEDVPSALRLMARAIEVEAAEIPELLGTVLRNQS